MLPERLVADGVASAADETDLVLTMKPAVVPKFLVGERLDGRRVDDFFVGAQGVVNDVVRDQGLSGTRRCGDQYTLAPTECLDGLGLKAVQI